MPKLYAHHRQIPAGLWRWPNFTPAELASPDDGSLLVDEVALDNLQALRKRLGKPLKINSAYRSPAHNAKLRGASPTSLHMRGKAFDIALKGQKRDELVLAAQEIGFTGIGHYDTFVHVDTGPARVFDRRKKRKA
jgi:zinc D-Ala-D-Ala carboxypeptidase